MTQKSLEDQLIWLLEVSRQMLATRDLSQLLTLVADSFLHVTNTRRAFVMLRDRKTGVLVQRVGRDADGGHVEHSDNLVASVNTRVFSEGKGVFETNTQDHQSNSERFVVCLPLINAGETIGTLYGDAPCGDGYDAPNGERRPIHMLADHVAVAIENARMFERATNDPLTGLPNSSYFLLELAKVMRGSRTGNEGGLVLLDIDSFKRVNTVGGAEVGDQALIDIAGTLQEVLRADGLVARYGSDKFAVLLPPDPALSIHVRLRDVAERARACVAAKTYHGVSLSACLGGLSFSNDTVESAPDLVAIADDALAKTQQRSESEVKII
jgi:diguanylate cyclase (GGDEF)-like protein